MLVCAMELGISRYGGWRERLSEVVRVVGAQPYGAWRNVGYSNDHPPAFPFVDTREQEKP